MQIRAQHPVATRSAFSLVELLVVVSVIMLLIAITLPVISMINHASIKRAAANSVMSVSIAMRSYADEDPRRFFPPQPTNRYLVYDAAARSNLWLLEQFGYKVPFPEIDQETSSPTYHALVDGWGQPIFYQLDGPYRSGTSIDSHLMNGTADRPAALPDWNPKGEEPFAYVWSLGRPLSGSASATTPDPSKTTNWIYQHGTP